MTLLGLRTDIMDQPAGLERLLSEGWAGVVEAARRIHSFKPEWVVIAGRGTSDNAARYAQYLLGAYNKLAVGLAVPSLYTLYGAPPNISRALTIGISQSGMSSTVVSVVEEANRQGGITLGITNNLDSPLAKASSMCIRLASSTESSVTASKTYTNQLLALAMLSVALEKKTSRWDALSSIPDVVRETLKQEAAIEKAAHKFIDNRHFAVTGRGFNYCTAHEIALKMKVTSYVAAEPYSSIELLHGPIAIIDEGFPVILASPDGAPSKNLPKLLEIIKQRNARLITISNDEALLEQAEVGFSIPKGVPEWLSPIPAVIPGQLLAHSIAFAKNIDPNNSRGVPKVVITE